MAKVVTQRVSERFDMEGSVLEEQLS
jgi:hypothetical protein